MSQPLTDAINALTTYANETTGENDTTLSDAVGHLVDGYGGGIEFDNIISGEYPTGRIVTNATSILDYRCGFHTKQPWQIYAPNCIEVGNSAFRGSNNLTIAVLPALTTVYTGYIFYQCTKLTIVDLGSPNQLINGFFNQCKTLQTVILRSNSVVNLIKTNCFSSTPFDSGGTGGTIYVPSDLISSYQSATNWSTIDGYGTVTWMPIEGSIYETQYADGTPISS